MKLLVFGSLNIDHVYQLHHLVRKGETIASQKYQKNLGGKGFNQAVALAKAGSKVRFAGAIGSDGTVLLDYLANHGIDTKEIKILDVPTGHAIIQVDESGDNSIVLFGGANHCISPKMIDEVLSGLCEGDHVLLQNEISNLEYIIRSAKLRNLNIILNPSPMTQELKDVPFEMVDWLILNEIEGFDLTGEKEAHEIIKALLLKNPGWRIVLTLGDEGCFYADAHRLLFQSAIQAGVVDTTAAGDTFTGYFLHAQLTGKTVESSLLKAAKAAALTVSRPGAAQSIPYAQEVDEALMMIT